MKSFLFLILILFSQHIASAQIQTQPSYPIEKPSSPELIFKSETAAVFPGDINSYIVQNLQYPDVALDNGAPDRIVLKFIIKKDGVLTDLKIARSSGDSSLDAEFLRFYAGYAKMEASEAAGTKCGLPDHLTDYSMFIPRLAVTYCF